MDLQQQSEIAFWGYEISLVVMGLALFGMLIIRLMRRP